MKGQKCPDCGKYTMHSKVVDVDGTNLVDYLICSECNYREIEGKVEETMERDIYDVICKQKLFYKKTDGGAEYLCTKPIEDSNIGDLHTAIIRLDGGAEVIQIT